VPNRMGDFKKAGWRLMRAGDLLHLRLPYPLGTSGQQGIL